MIWLRDNAVWLVPIVILILSELMPFLPIQANGVCQAVVNILKKTKWGAAAMVCLLLTGCATMNCSNQNSLGDDNKPAIKTDADATQTISPNTTATIPFK